MYKIFRRTRRGLDGAGFHITHLHPLRSTESQSRIGKQPGYVVATGEIASANPEAHFLVELFAVHLSADAFPGEALLQNFKPAPETLNPKCHLESIPSQPHRFE